MMPQLNLLLFTFPFTFAIGLTLFYLLAPDYISLIEEQLFGSTEVALRALRVL
jgi:flagellar biosynthesis protein FliR